MSLTDDQQDQKDQGFSRRNFIKTATAAAVGTTVATHSRSPARTPRAATRSASASSAAAAAAPGADPQRARSAKGVKIVAMGDAFKDRVEESRTRAKQRFARTSSAVPDDRMLRRPRRLQEGDRRPRRQLRHPGDAARLPPAAPRGGHRGRQAHLHREAGRRGRPPASARCSRRTRRRRRRSSASAPARSAATRPATSRR